MATTSNTTPPAVGSPEQLGFEALVAVLHIQANAIRPIDEALERAHQTNMTGFEVLARLSKLAVGASVRYLSEQVVISPSRVSRVADDFVSRGLIERAASPHDARLSLVRLTDQGRESLADMQQTFQHALKAHFLDRLTDRQIKSLIAIGRSLGAPHC